MGWMQGKAGQPEPNQPKSHKPQTGEQPRRKQEGGADGGPGHGCSGEKRAKCTYERENPIIRGFG